MNYLDGARVFIVPTDDAASRFWARVVTVDSAGVLLVVELLTYTDGKPNPPTDGVTRFYPWSSLTYVELLS